MCGVGGDFLWMCSCGCVPVLGQEASATTAATTATTPAGPTSRRPGSHPVLQRGGSPPSRVPCRRLLSRPAVLVPGPGWHPGLVVCRGRRGPDQHPSQPQRGRQTAVQVDRRQQQVQAARQRLLLLLPGRGRQVAAVVPWGPGRALEQQQPHLRPAGGSSGTAICMGSGACLKGTDTTYHTHTQDNSLMA